MSHDHEMTGFHDRGDDAAAFVLGALEPAEAEEFRGHLESCAACREKVAALQQTANALPMAAPQYPVPVRLRRRVRRQPALLGPLVPNEPRVLKQRYRSRSAVLVRLQVLARQAPPRFGQRKNGAAVPHAKRPPNPSAGIPRPRRDGPRRPAPPPVLPGCVTSAPGPLPPRPLRPRVSVPTPRPLLLLLLVPHFISLAFFLLLSVSPLARNISIFIKYYIIYL